MYSPLFQFIAILAYASLSMSVPEASGIERMTEAKRKSIQDRIQRAGGCNANVCFAIDASGLINSTEFTNEKNFVLDVSSVITVDSVTELAACLFAASAKKVSLLTSNIADFNLAIDDSIQTGGRSFVTGGINFCFSQLVKRRKEAIKIILLLDSKSNIDKIAVKRANLFRSFGGDVSVVAAGFSEEMELKAIVGGNPDRVFNVNSFLDVLSLQEIIENLVAQICLN